MGVLSKQVSRHIDILRTWCKTTKRCIILCETLQPGQSINCKHERSLCALSHSSPASFKMGMLRTNAVKVILFMVNMGAFGNPIKNIPNGVNSKDILLPPSELLGRVGVSPDLGLSTDT